jgi:AcrR family transcriptional regulator
MTAEALSSDVSECTRSSATREKLILAAEELFARQGLDAVSLRQVNVAAGQRNASAAHYHFGSKEALIDAVHGYRLERVNQRRKQRLAEKSAKGPLSLREIVEAVVFPLAEEVGQTPGGENYIQLLGQINSHPSSDLAKLMRSRATEGLQTCARLAAEGLPDVPPDLFHIRFGLLLFLAIGALASRSRVLVTRREQPVAAPLLLSTLIDVMVGMLAAPVSESTRQELLRETLQSA